MVKVRHEIVDNYGELLGVFPTKEIADRENDRAFGGRYTVHPVRIPTIAIECQQELDKMGEMLAFIKEMYTNPIILHCDTCDHEHESPLGGKCNWCGGKMIPIEQEDI